MRKETTVQCRTGESNFMETSESKKEWQAQCHCVPSSLERFVEGADGFFNTEQR